MAINQTDLVTRVNQVPTEPGCYLWKDKNGKVLYVGKAKNLRARMKQYVLGEDDRVQIPQLMAQVDSFDYVVVGSEHEALVLEINLIQQYKPYFNVDLKDDKSYPFIALTKGDIYPAIKYTREKRKKDTLYFGPYTDSRAARETIDILRKVCPICLAQCTEWKHVNKLVRKRGGVDKEFLAELQESARPCFDYHVGRGPGVCVGALTPEQYDTHIKEVEQFLSGKRKKFIDTLKEDIAQAARELDFEKAGRFQKRLEVLERLQDKQHVVLSVDTNLDAFGFYRDETIAGVCVFIVREGRVIRTCSFVLNKGLDVSEDELISSFVKRYYQDTSDIPPLIELPLQLEDTELLQTWLHDLRGAKVELHRPIRGDKARLIEMAQNNAHHAIVNYKVKTGYEDKRINEALLQLESALALDGPPMRIECFDISTFHGSFTVASMVVFTAGVADKSQYRRFKIKTPLSEANDVVSMAEVMTRRYNKEKLKDTKFGSMPDLLILDGGKPQLYAVAKQFKEMGLSIPMAGLAKSDEELFVLWDDLPVVLPSGSPSLYLVKRVRDEAHRFAITFHRELRNKAMTISILDEIEGIGPKRKKALKRHFRSFKKLKEASVEEIVQVDGISLEIAKTVYSSIRSFEEESNAHTEDLDILKEG